MKPIIFIFIMLFSVKSGYTQCSDSSLIMLKDKIHEIVLMGDHLTAAGNTDSIFFLSWRINAKDNWTDFRLFDSNAKKTDIENSAFSSLKNLSELALGDSCFARKHKKELLVMPILIIRKSGGIKGVPEAHVLATLTTFSKLTKRYRKDFVPVAPYIIYLLGTVR